MANEQEQPTEQTPEAAAKEQPAGQQKTSGRSDRSKRPDRDGDEVPELEDQVIYINRVAKVVKGGRRYGMTALVAVGDRHGRVGIGMGRATEVPIAINKGVEEAKRNLFTVPLTEAGTIPHEVVSKYGAGRIIIKPAVPGTGIIAGGPVRPLFELAGIKDVLSKSVGTDNCLNMVKAAAKGLQELSSPEQVAERRGMSVADIFGKKVQ
ncbi:MAG: 30S ribosomal protein S5 [Coriobacteriaceae bacterium]|nr:30S ribosomal protein S5 [Coriobacteriaceae bacterium]